MLAANEKSCICEIVELIPFHDLISIATTVTNNCVEIKTKEDAIKAILLHEQSLKSFLSRKKITRNVIFNYLHNKEINFDSTVDKITLVDLTIKYWEHQKSQAVVKQDTTQEVTVLGAAEASNLGYMFTEWFFNRLNADFNQSEGPELIEDDFWSDCQTTIYIPVSDNESHSTQGSSAKESLKLLKNVKSQYGLLFSPNLSPEGIKTVVEPHGLVIVMVCGTLHSRTGNCVGLFEHMFGLVKNPLSANNFKIKKMNLVLRSDHSKELKMISN